MAARTRTYAIFDDRGQKHRVSSGDRLLLPLVTGTPGSTVRFEKVLLYAPAGDKPVQVGAPTVSGAAVHAVIEAEEKDEKLRIYKWRRRENYHRRLGHRQRLTRVRITKVVGGKA